MDNGNGQQVQKILEINAWLGTDEQVHVQIGHGNAQFLDVLLKHTVEEIKKKVEASLAEKKNIPGKKVVLPTPADSTANLRSG